MNDLSLLIEALLFAHKEPLSVNDLLRIFEAEALEKAAIVEAIKSLQLAYEHRALELVEVGNGFRFQTKKDYAHFIHRLHAEKTPKYSRTFLETLVLIAYRQPITRADIEDIRGVTVNTQVIKTLMERDWIKVVGYREVPGKPELLATTKHFLDYFNLKSLSELPSIEALETALPLQLELLNASPS
jgi:segregation and condensation protein B